MAPIIRMIFPTEGPPTSRLNIRQRRAYRRRDGSRFELNQKGDTALLPLDRLLPRLAGGRPASRRNFSFRAGAGVEIVPRRCKSVPARNFALATAGIWCRLRDSNPRPPDYKSGALPAELSRLPVDSYQCRWRPTSDGCRDRIPGENPPLGPHRAAVRPARQSAAFVLILPRNFIDSSTMWACAFL